MINHLRLTDLNDKSPNFLAFSHWHPRVLEEHRNSNEGSAKKIFPKILSLERGREITPDRVPAAISSSSWYYFNVPSATVGFYRNYLNTVFLDQQINNLASGDHSVPAAIRKALSSNSSENKLPGEDLARLATVRQKSAFMAAEILIEEREMLEQKSKNKIVADKEKKVTIINNMTDDGKKVLRKIESEVKVLKRQLEVSAETNQLLQDKNREITDELEKMKVTVSKGITRSNIVCPIWHESHPKFCHYWLGFISFAEFVIYHKCLWPYVNSTVEIKDGRICDFEKSMITKMYFRKGLEFELIGNIWGRSNIGRYVKMWAPLWGEAGANLSILDINESILISLTPEDFVNGSTDKVCGLVDGKDFKTETIRTHSGITRAGHSNKVNCSALRVLSWVLNNGLNVERSEPYLGRASETHIVQVLGSHIGEAPLRLIDKQLYKDLKKVKRPIQSRVSTRNVGKMVAGVTKVQGEVMEGDEDIAPGEADSEHFCSRIDKWFQSMISADEENTANSRKKARIYSTEDHDVVEQAVLRSGPNKSPEFKLIQLKCLKRLHTQYACGNLESCLLS